MTERLDLNRIRLAVDTLANTSISGCLDKLKLLIIKHGGRGDLPSERIGEYNPLIKSAELFGVYAMAEDAAELPKNWLIAARNILSADAEDIPRPAPGAAPELGDMVHFQRSPTHHRETGTVRGRQFGTGIVEVEDAQSEIIRLGPGQYEAVPHV
ncbi:hypothetical protein [Ruegeria sp. HKCCD8929]|uniref:hypothetical protein n=1 Tax=Ruegeria sp. HKCCD8929 TaxID=2683006 RepID=UPI00148795C6|nr:hypothetical protein [Ruegeria sp. HKCCD8929]